MDAGHRATARTLGALLARGDHDAAAFRADLLRVPPADRDRWIDEVLGIDELPDDGPALPRDGVPYLPGPVDAVLRLVEHAGIGAADIFVDIGAGLGRAATLVHLLTGATAVGLEIQPHLVAAARARAARLHLARVAFVEGDAAQLAGDLARGTVFFLYCPFSGPRLGRVLADLEAIARARPIRVGALDLPLPPCPWLTRTTPVDGDLAVYRSADH